MFAFLCSLAQVRARSGGLFSLLLISLNLPFRRALFTLFEVCVSSISPITRAYRFTQRGERSLTHRRNTRMTPSPPFVLLTLSIWILSLKRTKTSSLVVLKRSPSDHAAITPLITCIIFRFLHRPFTFCQSPSRSFLVSSLPYCRWIAYLFMSRARAGYYFLIVFIGGNGGI